MNWSLIHMDRKYEQVLAKKKANKFYLPKYRKVDMEGGTYSARIFFFIIVVEELRYALTCGGRRAKKDFAIWWHQS